MQKISLYEFGGSEDLVRRTQERFVKFFRNSAPVLDIGCGRGVFLELLKKAGIEGVGIDHSSESITTCREKGFLVHQEDAREYLAGATGRFGGIFCSHVIEHMDYESAMTFLALCHQALRLGGILVIVTPNPEDIAVIAEFFWLDPTHIRPYPKLLLQSMLHANGFHIRRTEQFLGSWKMVGRRHLPAYFLRRLLFGRYFGRPNTFVLAEKTAVPDTHLQ
jgi:2-polyprenyl-3-methyl-5-hydroxy-6-metoxy-1,4-benzoquinol methylase